MAKVEYETLSGYVKAALDSINKHGSKRQDLCDYLDLFYENPLAYSWLLMEKKQAFSEPKLINA
jgi:hypothetical protein